MSRSSPGVALRAVFVLAGLGHLALVGYAARRVNTREIRAAEAAAEAEDSTSPLEPGAVDDADAAPDRATEDA